MARVLRIAAAAAVALTLAVFAVLKHDSRSGTDYVSFNLAHTSLPIHSSDLAISDEHDASVIMQLLDAAASSSAVSHEDEQALSDRLFHRAKFASYGSHPVMSSPPLASASHSSRAPQGDLQFFVHFSTPSDVRSLVVLQRTTGLRVSAHVQDGLYVAVGSRAFAAKARRFPGVSWVLQRPASSKISTLLQLLLNDTFSNSAADGATELVAECWHDACARAAAVIKSVCPDVYLHPTLVEAHCPHTAVRAAVLMLSEHTGVDYIDVKAAAFGSNMGGRAIIGNGPDATTPDSSRVLSEIDVSGSIVAVADSGIDMNSCFFYDSNSSRPWNNSRVVLSYVAQPCEMCGRCCGFRQAPNCTNALNSCGNFVDENFHGTHVAGTVAGAGPADVAYGNGIARGAKIFFQDIENILTDDQCFAPDGCRTRNYPPTDWFNLFKPAYDAGARVHSNSWGLGPGPYNTNSRAIDAFVFSNPSFLVLVASGNDGAQAPLGTVGSSATCKNCLVVGATQQSEVLFRSMSPFVDNGQFCSKLGPQSKLLDPCCGNPLTCIDSCCHAMSLLNTSFACCANQTTCGNDSNCSVQSGNLRSARNVAAFSSRGPTADGRFKPDLVAPGEDILSAATPAQTTPGAFQSTAADHCDVPSNQQRRSPQADFNRALQLLRGTSMATPLVAGAAEKIRQYFMQGYYPRGLRQSGISFEPAEALVRAVLLASCVSVFSDEQSWGVWSRDYPFVPGFFRFPLPSEAAPNFFQGFGLPVLDHVPPPSTPSLPPLL